MRRSRGGKTNTSSTLLAILSLYACQGQRKVQAEYNELNRSFWCYWLFLANLEMLCLA